MIYHETPSGTLHQGEVLEILRTLPDESVNCCVTSPPYWGLRDYGTAEWEGGDQECDHKQHFARNDGGRVNTNGFHGSATEGSNKGAINYRDQCPKCGAIRKDRQLGLERTPEEYVARMVDIFREVRRVLRKDGTLWLNLGDSYNGSGGAGGDYNAGGIKEGQPKYKGRNTGSLKPKDLVGIPWRVAFALQADGWYLRQDIIWHKPNPMPESVTDRCTKAHEYVFLMSKSAKYYYDNDAIRQKPTGRTDPITSFGKTIKRGESYSLDAQKGANKRSVWSIATKPFKEAHFATFPRDLIRPMIQAGCPADGVVLDPFMGSGTTAIEAIYQGKRYIGIDLNSDYCAMAAKRIDAELEQTVIDFP
jgi:DNA modification methylase